MEEEIIAMIRDAITGAIREVGLDPDVIKQKAKSCVNAALRKREINGENIRLISRSIILGSFDAAKETISDPAFVGQHTAEGVLEEIREFSEKSDEYITTAQYGVKEAFQIAIDSSEEEEFARSLKKLMDTINPM